MNKRILFLANRFADSTSANGICVKNVVNDLLEKGHEVFVISDRFDDEDGDEENESLHIFKIRAAWSKRIMRAINNTSNQLTKRTLLMMFFLKKVASILTYPDVSPIRSRQLQKMAEELINQYNIEKIVCVYRAYDTIQAGMKIKEKNKKIRLITYHLDIINSPSNTRGVVRKIKQIKGKKAVSKEFKVADRIILPTSAKQYIQKDNPNVFFADFPLYLNNPENVDSGITFSKEEINIVYVGSLDISNRNPLKLFEILKKINSTKEKKIRIHMWGNIEREILQIILKYDFISYNGIIDNKFVCDILNKADILLNVSNQITYNMVPSKIFQLFSIQKPIVNLAFSSKDISLSYFNTYGYSLILFNDHLKEQSNEIVSFIWGASEINNIDNGDKFITSKPEFTSNIISMGFD